VLCFVVHQTRFRSVLCSQSFYGLTSALVTRFYLTYCKCKLLSVCVSARTVRRWGTEVPACRRLLKHMISLTGLRGQVRCGLLQLVPASCDQVSDISCTVRVRSGLDQLVRHSCGSTGTQPVDGTWHGTDHTTSLLVQYAYVWVMSVCLCERDVAIASESESPNDTPHGVVANCRGYRLCYRVCF
jgi:hypothetical protein